MSAIGTTNLDDTYDTSPSCIEFLDYIPIISTITGIARLLFGVIETLFGLIVLPFQLTGRDAEHKKPLTVIEGLANMFRGVIAIKPVIGNVILYIYDHSPHIKRDIRRGVGLE